MREHAKSLIDPIPDIPYNEVFRKVARVGPIQIQAVTLALQVSSASRVAANHESSAQL